MKGKKGKIGVLKRTLALKTRIDGHKLDSLSLTDIERNMRPEEEQSKKSKKRH